MAFVSLFTARFHRFISDECLNLGLLCKDQTSLKKEKKSQKLKLHVSFQVAPSSSRRGESSDKIGEEGEKSGETSDAGASKDDNNASPAPSASGSSKDEVKADA